MLRGLYIAIPLLFLLALGMFWDQQRTLSRDKIEAEEQAALLKQENARLRTQIGELKQAIEQKQNDLARRGPAREAAP
ncbi:MAG: hypothetical protein A2150_03685 [Candidatus Muproteobacteria bacterium RBG_16_64_11]|uniref:Uncharacterized protein n=1 Tax=Candidatus Muproteobacteria bacterium RBG_16_64_11 TaxID=1817758 RepID=A0A1F6TC64_9PROT|nr:MAG: hypothetical protein A2150_03685 [Candidatus Muproteobacteria bacterium RBG_16_64_11]